MPADPRVLVQRRHRVMNEIWPVIAPVIESAVPPCITDRETAQRLRLLSAYLLDFADQFDPRMEERCVSAVDDFFARRRQGERDCDVG